MRGRTAEEGSTPEGGTADQGPRAEATRTGTGSRSGWRDWWVPVAVCALMLLVIILDSGTDSFNEALRNPILIGGLGAIFIYLTMDRLREMTARIDRIDGNVSSFWQETSKTINSLAASEVRDRVGEMHAALVRGMEEVEGRVDSLLDKNPWLRHAEPSDLVFHSKHLEPILVGARRLFAKGEADIARKMVTEAINDPEVKGTPNDYHNVAVFIARDLDDDLLAQQVHEIYFRLAEDPNPDVLADALEVCTRVEDYARAEQLAGQIRGYIDAASPRFVTRWRPWVFLADYYAARGQSDEAVALLRQARDFVASPKERPHVIRNLGDLYQKLGRLDEAEAVFRECLDEYPSHVTAYLQLADLLWIKGDVDGSIRALKDSLAKGNLDRAHDHHIAAGYGKLARLSMAAGDKEAARDYAGRALAMGAGETVYGLLKVLADDRDSPAGDPRQDFRAGVALALTLAAEVLPEEQVKRLRAAVVNRLSAGNQ